jgi:hypothetical protein
MKAAVMILPMKELQKQEKQKRHVKSAAAVATPQLKLSPKHRALGGFE